MKKRVNIVACALVLGAFAAPAAQAAPTRSPGSGSHAAPAQRFNAFSNLGREGSGLVGDKSRAQRHAALEFNAFANLGREGSGLVGDKSRARRHAPLEFNAFANLGHEGSGLNPAPLVVAERPWAM
jgi:hypothetical protein